MLNTFTPPPSPPVSPPTFVPLCARAYCRRGLAVTLKDLQYTYVLVVNILDVLAYTVAMLVAHTHAVRVLIFLMTSSPSLRNALGTVLQR